MKMHDVFVAGFFATLGLTSTLRAEPSADTKLLPAGPAWAMNSVNATIFRQDPITTAGDTQFVSYYDAQGGVVIAKRTIGESTWTPAVTPFTGNTKDAHNGISIIADGEGYLHLSWDHHGHPLRYARSTTPGGTAFEKLPMSGRTESNVTYPQFFQMPDGGLLFMFRDGASGRGNLALNRYDPKTKTWTQLFANLISGENKRNAYWQACVDGRGRVHVSWVWRDSPDVATNHDVSYARSDDGGRTWVKSDGTAYALPITMATAEVAAVVPQKSELMNQTSMCADGDGNPVIATYFRPKGATAVQYCIVRHDGKRWSTAAVTERKADFKLGGGGSKAVPISRPQVVSQTKAGKTGVWVIFRDTERGGRVSLAGCADVGDAKWTTVDLTDFDVKFWEPSYDHVRWQRDGVLNLYVQVVGQGDGETLQDVPPQAAQVLEWKP